MNLDHLTKQTPLSGFSGFDLAIGSVFALRWFAVDSAGRLRGVGYPAIWKPGENIATCRADEGGYLSFSGTLSGYYSVALTSRMFGGAATPTRPTLAEAAVDSKVTVEHLVPMPSCGCGFWAYARGDNSGHKDKNRVLGVVECYGRTILGTKGLRAEKARIVALATRRKDVRRLYPDVKFYRSARLMSRRFDIVRPVKPGPETDPTFWGDEA